MAKKIDSETTLYAHIAPKSIMAEAYRTLRTNLNFAAVDRDYRSILISSTNPQDGKSQTTANLAVALALSGNRVILVDADLRKPTLHKIFRLANERGLTNCLAQNRSASEVGHTGMIENLTILTSGPIPPNPSEMLGSERAKALWPALLEEYDYVLIDSPPIIAVADASVLAAQVDGVVLVVNSGKTRIDIAQDAKAQLQKANANIIGVVLNKFKMDNDYYSYYYYYGGGGSADDAKIKF